ncbi:hypothetical protein PO902_17065 [Planococcus maritimus]|nr:hypothetical protein [Planococcus sp. SK3692]MDE4086759.1 hypothetical protein [Planococcus maritimus]
METKTQGAFTEAKPIVLTLTLVLASILLLVIGWQLPNVNFWVYFFLYSLIDFGFLFSLILGIRTKNKPVMFFSVIANSIFFAALSSFIFLLLLGHGISEP